MLSIRTLALGLATLLVAPVVGCAPSTGVDDNEVVSDDADELSLPLTKLDVRKSNAPSGLTVITKKSEFVAFFGENPPTGVDFNKSWLLHYSMGVQPTGGYGADITQVERIGSGANARLVPQVLETMPGPNCIVTQALSNAQVAVLIPKQNKKIEIAPRYTPSITDCGTEQNWCTTALCGPNTTCDEFQDACVEDLFCPRARCANGYVCDEELDACVGWLCDPQDSNSCPSGFACENQIACITQPCPTEYRCEPAPAVTCEEIGWVGVCQGPDLKYCDGDVMHTVNCAPGQCGWDAAYEYYDCL